MKNVEDIYQLSPAQEATLAATIADSTSVRLGQMSCVLAGSLDLASLEWAWQQVLNRHSILRTSFVWKRLDKPLQVVNRELLVAIQAHDWQSLSEEQQRENLAALRNEELGKGIDPAVPPLARVVLCQTSQESAHLILTYHPLILDERSVSLLLHEVFAYYASAGNGRSPQLASGTNFWSYVSWLKEQDLAGAETFWRESLRDFNGQTPLEDVYSRGDAATGFDQVVIEIPHDSLEALADRAQVKLETLMHAAWALLLHRETGDEDFVYGYARTPENLAGKVLGPLSTILPVRVKINPHTSAISFIKSLATRVNEIRRHSFFNVKELAGWQSVVSDVRDDFVEVQGSRLKVLNVETFGPVNLPIVVSLAPQLHIRYDRRLFARETIERIGAHFQTLLDALVSNPDQTILDLPFMTAAEIEELSLWNRTTTEYPRESCIHELFEQQAQSRPAQIAIAFEDQQLTYAELNARANQLAHHLRSLGVQPETRIALCIERSLEMMVGMLGILKAGGAFAPLDPSHPLERLSFMLEDLQAPVVITQQNLLDKLPAFWGQVISLDSDWETISLESTENPVNEATADNLAYVMYTSGSTGTPKGVSVSHRAVVRLVQNTNYAHFGPDEVVLQFAPISFDASTMEIWGALLNGGCLAIMPPSLPSLDVFGQALRKHSVTTLWLTAGLFHLMVDERLGDLESVKQLVAGGDALSLPHVKKAFQGLAGCQLINGYGPTEGTTFTCCYPVKDMDQLRTSVPIGRPISNTQAYILDRHLRAVPAGVVGELYIGGDGLARDYLNRPDLTAEKFVPSTQGGVPGARLYKTGDLVRYLPDGNIEFLGRRDSQVKIRGFRIELGEVETALSTHPALQDAVVVARADIAGEKQLVGYVVGVEGKSVSSDELRDFLRQKLPEHMVPSAFVPLEAFPLTANGKVDRKALPAPDADRRGTAHDFVAPRTEVEELLAVIWSQALGVDEIGIDDNFFSLGGDSIRSVQVLAKVQERGLILTLQDLFQYQTIREVALIASKAGDAERFERTQPFDLVSEQDRLKLPTDLEDAYPLTMLQAGMIFHSELNPGAGVFHDIFSHHVRAPYNPDALRSALASLVQEHAALRTCFVLHDYSEPLQLVVPSVEVPLHVGDLRDLSPEDQDRFLREHLEAEKNRGFDWGRAPLAKIELHRRSNESFQFTISFHHAVLDGWSLASLLAGLFERYVALIEHDGAPVPIKPLDGSYRDYVAMELKAVRSKECRDYWSGKLRGSSPPPLPHPFGDDQLDSSLVHRIEVNVSHELSARLKDLARSTSVPIKSVLLAAHLKVMGFLSGESDVVTGLISNGRPEEGDGERLLGLFLNTIPFRQNLSTGTWRELVQQTFQNEWEALPFRWYPLAQMQREQGSQSLFETAFNFLHFHVAAELQTRGHVELLDSITFERTNLPLIANFSLNLNSSDVHLQLTTDGARLTKKQTEAIADYYREALTAMAYEPEGWHQSTSLFSDSAIHQLLYDWNSTALEFPGNCPLSELFELQVERAPAAVALISGNERISYEELNRRANQLAHHLVQLGVGPETLVGVCVERSIGMVVALLGVLKAGAAYVPLDPSYPAERLSFMVQDAEVSVLLRQEGLMEQLPAEGTTEVLIDTDWERIAQQGTENLNHRAVADNLAYVIYTSGSTGRPKGVQAIHRAVINRLHWMWQSYPFETGEISCLKTRLSFVDSIWELFGPMLQGVPIVIVPEAVVQDPLQLIDVLADGRVSRIVLVPSLLRVILDNTEDLQERLSSLKHWITSGEALPEDLCRDFHQRLPQSKLLNLYGSSEVSADVTWHETRSEETAPVPIGVPISNTQIYLLDQQGQPVPVGVTGDLYVGGEGLARGYWRQAGLTAERFVPDNLSGKEGARLFATGDRARYREDGAIEYLGRLDHQVKIRGFRIELGEIETQLLSHPEVREAVVLARRSSTDDARLAAYLVAKNAPAPAPESLRSYLQETLPDYMVPSAFVLLDEMPLTPSGKVNRLALPAPGEEALAVSSAVTIAPRNEIEQLVHSIWAAVLKVENFGIHHNFFALGGHSLLATQVMTRLRESLQLAVPLRELFTHPTVAELAQWVRTAMRNEGNTASELKPMDRTQPLPLSFAQQRLWLVDQLTPGTALYNMPLAVWLRGPLDAGLLEQAVNEIVRRHEVLRTSFAVVGDEPVQVIAAAQTVELVVEDLSGVEDEQREAAAKELAHAEAQEPFDLSRGPLLRARLLRLGAEEHLAMLTMHHVISDGWSVEILLREVAQLYAAYARGEASPLPELEIQYADYAVWQREWLKGEELERQLGYWRKQLGGAPAVLELPLDHPRPAVQTHHGEIARFSLTKSLSEELQQLSRREGVTMFMTLLAAFKVLLHRYSGADEVMAGTPIAGRNRKELEPLIGFFVNTLVLRTALDDDPSFLELLERVREVCLGAYAHQDISFEKLIEELQPERDSSYSPLFQVMFTFQDAMPGMQFSGLEVLPLAEESGVAKFDLTLSLREGATGLLGVIEYNTDLFEAETIERMVGHLTSLLEGIAADAAQLVSELPLITEREKRQLVEQWSETEREYVSVHEIFERQAQSRPEALAVACEGKEFTYAEVNERANRLAHYLRRSGVGPDELVGVLMERSVEMVVGLLGVMKAGGAYLPLDPNYPKDRIAFILEDARLSLLLTQERLVHTIPENSVRVVSVDAEWEIIARESGENPRREVSKDNLVYVIYTSGSTGKPKGVCVPHGSLLNHCRAIVESFQLQPADRALQFASLSFDAAAEELYATWLAGATVVLMPNDYLLQTFLSFIEDQRVSVVNLTASYWYEWVGALSRGEAVLPSSLRLMATGSEKVSIAQLVNWQKVTGNRVGWLNAYGPTEATITTTLFKPEGELKNQGIGSVPIGRPINNVRVYILDKKLRPVPVGIAGELHIGGMGVVRGYLNRPELTAEKFIPDLFSSEAGGRLYRTGDWARYLPDGNIEFLKRIDKQVKVRGFRIELGEIEAALSSHADVQETAVVVREDEPEDKRIVAYVVPQREGITAGTLHAYLSERLPGYMVPSAVVLLPEMPRTVSGKTDRRALPAPSEEALAVSDSAPSAPRSEIEQLLHSIWAAVLKRDRFGIHDSFFAIGGHSLLATQVITRVRAAFKVEVPLSTLFESPTLAGFAESVQALLREQQGVTAPSLTRAERSGPLPLSFAQQRLWFIDQLGPGSALYNMPLAVRLRGSLEVAVLERAVSEVVRRHEVLRTGFELVDEVPVQVIAVAQPIALAVEDLSALTAEQREEAARELVEAEAQRPFDLSRGPLLRARLVRLEEEEHLAMLTMHHVISDGWSMDVLLREVALLYGAFVRGESSPLPELEIQYADYAVWQRDWLQGEELERQLGYWRKQLGGAPAVLELPMDHARPAVQTHKGAAHRFVVDAEVSDGLKQVSRASGVTTFMVLLAAWQVLLKKLSGTPDISVGTAVAGRTDAALEPLIGFFVNTLVLRTDLSGDPTFAELLERVREVCVGAYGHQDVPFEKLVEELAPERSLAQAPLFQVMLVMQQQQTGVVEQIEGLAVSGVGGETASAKYDLTMNLRETGGALSGELEYNTDIFEVERAQRMVEQWQRVLAAAVAAPQRRISELSLLSEAERQQLLVEWNDTAAEYPSEMTLPQLFEAQVERTPEAVALIFENERISYRELNRRANQLAHHLVSMDVGPEQLVGISVDRSVGMVVAMIATQKAGAAYVPLDPQYPWARLQFMIEDAGVRVLLTQEELKERFAAGNLELVCLDTDGERIGEHEETNLSTRANAANLAHVIYTSGSTGQPKGVAIDHHSAGALIAWATSAFSSEELSGVLASTSISFDLSIFELFVPLTCGGTVILAENALHLPQLSAVSEVKLINTVPSAMAELVRMQAVPASVRTINLAGEPLTNVLVQSIYTHRDTVERVLNLYGPSEDTTYSTWAACARGASGQPTIGRPIANGQVYILSAQQQPVPAGVTGELYVGGKGVARGYLNRPALTAERFVPNPFSEKPGARLYRTGDLARYLPNGEIEFLGRIDHQVKIRGFRIELGEIEARLLEHPDVAEAVVVARKEEDGDHRIIAYVVAGGQAVPQPKILSAHVRETLPHYMAPSAFVLLNEIPLTPNGKVDRRALPDPDREALALSPAGVVAPRTEIEQLLHSIWSGVLKMESFGVHDNFFALGGHSLLAMQVITRMRAALNLPLPLRELFMHPTLAELGRLVETVLHDESSAPPRLQRADRTGRLPLSFAQQRLWFIDQLAPGSALYNMPLAVRLRGSLQVQALDQALSEIVGRHEVLRTTFELVDGEPVQVITPAEPLALEVEDLSALRSDEREQMARELIKAEAQQPFDLSEGPLLRARLLRLDEEDHIALLTMHHISSDGWSMQVLLREVGLLYGAYTRGNASPLPELEIQYADYAVWQREWLQGEELERQLGYWRKQLGGAPAVLELPMDHPRPAVQTHNGATYWFELNEEVSEHVRELSRAAGMTTFMVLLAAWQVLLKGLSATTDISVGTAVAGRTDAAVEPLIGFFVNTLVLRTDLSGDPTFAELLERVREVCVGAYGHQDVPFEKLIEELAPERSQAHAPLFQVMLVMQQQQQQQQGEQIAGLEVTGVGGEVVSAKYDLTLHMLEAGGTLSGELEYNTDIFAQERARRMVEQWEGILAAAVAQPQRRISELPLLSETERQQLVEWNQTAAEYPPDTLPKLFEAQVERTPEAVALIFENERISYCELNRRANQLARHLGRRGVGAESLVGVLMERSVEMVVTLLGILKAGGAYVPLDAAYPDERLRLMVQDAGIELLLTQQKLRARAAAIGCDALCLEDLSSESEQNPAESPDPDTLAYVIYTSGSTGVPKGVTITHRAIANHMQWMQDAFPLTSEDCVVQRTPFSFDASVWEVYAPLLNGATLVMHQPETHLDPAALIATINDHHVTTLQIVPSLLRMVMEVAELESCQSLRRVFCGGEALMADVVKQFRERLSVPLYNLYGPTEATIDATVSQATDEDGPVPIGRPIANTETYVLDEQLQRVPIGVVGQLYIAGTGLARGYLGRPQLTAEKFIPNPFNPRGGERLYATGDRARYRTDGQIAFLGRQDRQVNVRGVRIELGEIEARLLEHPDVLEAAVVYQEGTKPRLAAYVVSGDPGLTGSEIRFYLKENLPEFMVPSILMVERLPATTKRKSDRRTLQVREVDAPTLEDSFLAPRDVLEFQLVQFWEDLLKVKPIGVRDNFFELGGHSFLAVRLMARIKETTGKTLPLTLLMQEGTIESLASELRQAQAPASASPLVAIRREGSAPAFFCVHPAGGNVLCYQALAQHLGPARPFYAFQARGFEDGEEPFTSVEAAAAHYVEAMRAIQPEGPYLIGGWSIGGLIAFEMARLVEAQQQQVGLLAMFDSHLDPGQPDEADDATLLINSALHMGLRREDLQPLVESLRTLDKDAQLDYAFDHLRRKNLLPPGSEASQIRALIRVFKANVEAARNYLPVASKGRITLFKARESVAQSNGSSAKDWAPLALDGVEVREIPGDHFSMMREPHVRVLAKYLNESLQQASEATFSAASR